MGIYFYDPNIRFSSSQLRAWVLEVANLMIDAARLESRDDVVLMQSILVFKMTLTLAKFEEVHTLCPPKDWPVVKKGANALKFSRICLIYFHPDLLDYLVAHDSTLPGSPITLKMQVSQFRLNETRPKCNISHPRLNCYCHKHCGKSQSKFSLIPKQTILLSTQKVLKSLSELSKTRLHSVLNLFYPSD